MIAGREWLAHRQAELPPVPYSDVVFLLPNRLPDKATVYAILFRAVELRRSPPSPPILGHLGAQIGVTAVLHTQHHPHLRRWPLARRHVAGSLAARLLLKTVVGAVYWGFEIPLSPDEDVGTAQLVSRRLRPSTEAFGKQAGGARYSNVITLAVNQFT